MLIIGLDNTMDKGVHRILLSFHGSIPLVDIPITYPRLNISHWPVGL